MGVIKKLRATARHNAWEDERRIRAFSMLIKDMVPEVEYTLRRSDGKIITMTGEQWKSIAYSQPHPSA